MQSLVSSQSFPHLWKKLWKNAWKQSGVSIQGLIDAVSSAWAKPSKAVNLAFFKARFTPACGKSGVEARRKLAEGRFSLEYMNFWEEILARIEMKVNRHSFYTWFRPTTFVTEDRSSVTVRVPNALFKDWLTKHYSGAHPPKPLGGS